VGGSARDSPIQRTEELGTTPDAAAVLIPNELHTAVSQTVLTLVHWIQRGTQLRVLKGSFSFRLNRLGEPVLIGVDGLVVDKPLIKPRSSLNAVPVSVLPPEAMRPKTRPKSATSIKPKADTTPYRRLTESQRRVESNEPIQQRRPSSAPLGRRCVDCNTIFVQVHALHAYSSGSSAAGLSGDGAVCEGDHCQLLCRHSEGSANAVSPSRALLFTLCL
jgi:hypothetical protein